MAGKEREAPLLTERLVELIESGVSIIVGTRDANLRPDSGRGLGARVSPDRRHITLLLNGDLCTRLRANIEDNGRIAVAFSRIHDHQSIQLKGRVTATRDGSPREVKAQGRYLIAFAEQLANAGFPRSVVRNVQYAPCFAVDVEVAEVFDQTPGPGAGNPLSPA